MVAGREIWPQFAPQFTGQVFLLDQPGSVLAEAVADVERVSVLNEALRAAESDRRTAVAEHKVRLSDRENQEIELSRFDGVDEVAKAVHEIEETRVQAERVQRALLGLQALQDRLGKAQKAVTDLDGIDALEIPPCDAVLQLGAEKATLEGLRVRLARTQEQVTSLSGIESLDVSFDLDSVKKIQAVHENLAGLHARWLLGCQQLRRLEEELVATEAASEDATREFLTALKDVGQCPLCGVPTVSILPSG